MLNLNLTDATEQGTSIPDGTYSVVVNKAEVGATRSGGQMVKVQLKITGETQVGRVVFEQFNIENANPEAVKIGLGQLKGMMKAFGHSNPNLLGSAEELMGLRGLITVKTVDDAQYGPQTKVKAYKPYPTPSGAGTTTTDKVANPFG